MELKDYLRIIKENITILIVITILITVGAFLFAFFKPLSYDASIAFSVNRINKQETEDYQFDGYYAIQASDLFSQTIVSWFSTPSVILEVYNQAGIDPRISSLDEFASRFHTKKYSSQNIVVKFNERDRETTQKISRAIISVIKAKTQALNRTSDQKALFEVTESSPVIVETKASLVLFTVIGLILGLVVSLIIIYLVNYFKTESPREEV